MLRQTDTLSFSGLADPLTTRSDPARSRIFKAITRTESVPVKASFSRTQRLLELASKVVAASWGGIGVITSDGKLVEHRTVGLPARVASGLNASPVPAHFTCFLLRQPGAVRLGSIPAEEFMVEMPANLPPIKSFLGVPLICPTPYQGALYLVRSGDQPTFVRNDEEAVLALRTWIDQENLLEESSLLSQMRLLNQVAQTAAGNLDLAKILAVALRELDRQLPLHVAAVWLRDGENKDPSVEPGASPIALALTETGHSGNGDDLKLERGTRVALEETCFESAVTHGQPVYTDLEGEQESGNPMVQRLLSGGATVSFAVPLRAGEQTFGVLQSVCKQPAGFTREQIQLLYLVADLLGPAVSNCQLFDRLRAAYEELRLTQSQLIQGEKMRALGELAGGMAHDFNNALCGALGFLELALLNQQLTPDCRGYLESSRTLALDAAQTVRRVQDFARWRRNEGDVELLDVNDLVQQTIELTRPKWEGLAQARGVVIDVEVKTEGSEWISGNGHELREVVTNLVFNAVDAMPHGGRLSVRTSSTDKEIFIAVQDSGVGMSEAVKRRLFEPFFTTKGENGTGLGLSVSFGIVQRFGGEIVVESAEGRGSTFQVRLPKEKDPAENHVKPHAGSALPSARHLRVLVIEDEDSVRRFLTTGLTQLGHRAQAFATGQEGLAALAEESFDVVVTDLGLPGITGEEVARTIAQRTPQTPVVLLTGWADQIEAGGKKMEGVTKMLGKPVQLQTLAAALAEVASAGANQRA
jgi:signal transduction histidine kinase/ActR/RegA family two-component response regulator